MALMSGNDESCRRDFVHSFQLTNYILDSGATCHITPQVSGFIPGALKFTYKNIEVADGHYVTAKQKYQIQIRMCDNNRDIFIATLHNVVLALDLCDRLFLIIKLMYLLHTCLFHKEFCMVYFGDKDKNAVTLPHIEQK